MPYAADADRDMRNDDRGCLPETRREIIDVIAFCAALVLWSLATMWLIYALLAVAEVLRVTRFPFKQAFWGLIFPNVSPSLSRVWVPKR